MGVLTRMMLKNQFRMRGMMMLWMLAMMWVQAMIIYILNSILNACAGIE
jgi:hypothetical protein